MKEILFISYANENSDKVKLITKDLENHPIIDLSLWYIVRAEQQIQESSWQA
jgi:hypothetical protein